MIYTKRQRNLTTTPGKHCMQMIEAAKSYAAAGWKVFPLKSRSKDPITKHGIDDASDSADQIARWWKQWPASNVAVLLGEPSGMFMVDCDPIRQTNKYDGMANWATLQAHYGATGETRQQHSGGGGEQFFFEHPGAKVQNHAPLLPGIDIKADRGYVVASPSIHPETGKTYTWANEAQAIAAPAWLLSILFDDDARLEALRVLLPDPTERQAWAKEYWRKCPELRQPARVATEAALPALPASSDEMKRWLTVAMDKAYQAVAAAGKGGRNAALNRETYSLAGLIPHISQGDIERLMFMAAERCGYVNDDGETEVLNVIKSAIESGSKAPRQLPELTPSRPAVVIPGMELDDSGFTPSDAGTKAAEIIAEARKDEIDLVKKEMTDAGNAECMAALCGARLRYDHISGMWRIWDRQRWLGDQDGEAVRLALATIRARRAAFKEELDRTADEDAKKKVKDKWAWALRGENVGKIEAMIKMAKSLIDFATLTMQYDKNLMLVNAGDVTIDLTTVQVRENRREDLITQRIGPDYDPLAICPRWDEFLREVWPGLPNIHRYIQRMFGYCLTGNVSERAFFLCHGSGRNGKSVTLNVLKALVGEYGKTIDFTTFDIRNPKTEQVLAAIRAARVVTLSEANQGMRLNEAIVKQLTGNEEVTARELYGKHFNYRPQFKIIMAVNHLPVIKGDDIGIWSRVHRIPFLQNFEGREDKDLERKLRAELPGILNWALEGLREWHKQGLNPPREILDATEEYKESSDVIGRWISDCCFKGDDKKMPAQLAYNDYQAWANRSGLTPMNLMEWTVTMKERFPYKKPSNVAHYYGVGLNAKDGLNL